MSYEAVNVFVQKSDTTAIAGVVVKAFNQAGTVVFDQQTTSAEGVAAFLLESGITYQLRFFKQQVSIPNPQYITVQVTPTEVANNDFNVTGQIIAPPTATDPRLCRLSGYFKRPNGAPAPNVDIHFIVRFEPLLLDGAAMLTERVHTRTDKNGYAELDLVRFAKYDVTVQGFEDLVRVIGVPDAPSANLPDVLFPVVASVSFDPIGPYTVATGQEIILVPTVLASSGLELDGTALEDVTWRSSNADVLALSATATTLILRGVAPGTAQITAERVNNSILRIPDTGIAGQPVTVTVT